MGLSCGMSMVKYGLFIFNLVCAVAGIALIVVGSLPLFQLQDIRDAFPENESPALVPILVLVLGSVIFIISFFGCCGAIRESQCMVSTYAFFLLVLVVAQIVLAVYAFMYTEEFANVAKTGFDTLWNDMLRNDQKATAAIDGIQRGLQCCGRTGPSDWTQNSRDVPASCCAEGANTCSATTAFDKGCGTLLFDVVRGSGVLIAWIAVVFAAFELVGVIFACCLANSIRNTTRRQYA